MLPRLPARFEAVEALPSTPFERTFRAFDTLLHRQVLLKLPGAGAWDGWSAPARDRLLREARALAKLRHDGIEPIHWVEDTADGPLLVLDLPQGESLLDRLRAGPMDVAETVDLGIQVAEALGAVHYHGIVHRAVGCESVRVLADGKVRLGTFTFAKGFEARPQMSSIDHKRRSEPKIAAFLPPYVAPEQLSGHGADPRTDVFALGCLLYRCLCGEDPFANGAEVTTAPDLRRRRGVPKNLGEVLRRCMHAAPTARYPTAQAVADALRAARAAPAPAGGGGRAPWAIAAGAVAALIAVYLLFTRNDGGGSPRREESAASGRGPGEAGPLYDAKYDGLHALLIGIAEEYDIEPYNRLLTPVNEVIAIEQRLRSLDPKWQILVLKERDASRDRILAELDRLEKDAKPDDGVLLYFAGHGVRRDPLGRQFHLVAADVNGPDPRRDDGYVDGDAVRAFMDQCKAKHVLTVLDCCSAGSILDLERGRTAPEASAPGKQDEMLRHRSREILVAAGRNAKARDGQRLPTFCRAFLAALDPVDGPYKGNTHVDARGLYGHILCEMKKDPSIVGTVQEPQLDPPEGDGSFVFFLR